MLSKIVSLLTTLLLDATGSKDEVRKYLATTVAYLKNHALLPRMKVFYETVLWAINNDITWDIIWALLPISGIVGASPEAYEKEFEAQLFQRSLKF